MCEGMEWKGEIKNCSIPGHILILYYIIIIDINIRWCNNRLQLLECEVLLCVHVADVSLSLHADSKPSKLSVG